MPLVFQLFLIALFSLPLNLQAQPNEEPSRLPKELIQAIENENIEKPPGDPIEAPVQRPPRRRTRQTFNDPPHPNAIFGQKVLIDTNEVVNDLVLIGGSADIRGTVERDVVIIGGSAKISGTVGGDLVLIGGTLHASGEIRRHVNAILSRVELTDTARLSRGGFFLGGPFKFAPGATIIGERVMLPIGDFIPQIEGLKAWLVKGLLWGRLLPVGVTWAWIVAGVFVGVYLLTLILFPAAIKAIFVALEQRPVTSILSGFLTLILFAPLMAILAIAVVGIPVIPFLQVALILSLLFGKAGVMCFLGRSFGRSAGASFLQVPLTAFFIGAALLVLAYMIPIFGLLAWVLTTVFGLGGAVVALSRTFQREEGSVRSAPVLISSGSSIAGTPPSVAGAPGIPPVAVQAPGDTLLLQRAGFWKRFVAALLDFILLGLLVPVLKEWFILLAVVYFVTMWTWKGTTIGSLVLGLKVVRTDGRPVNFGVALVRSLSSFFSALVLFLGFLWTAWDRDKQSWHDKIAGTIVVKMPKGFALV